MSTKASPSRRQFLQTGAFAAGTGILALGARTANAAEPLPNILWLTWEDQGPELGCYGDPYADTPFIDQAAKEGMRYKVAWSNAPVCAPARTTLISGVYPTALGGQHMRSEVKMPSFMKMYPQFLREKGYYCTNNSKEDYNVEKPGEVWDDSSNKAHYKNRADGQPFFSIFNFTISHESQIRNKHELVHDPAKARVRAYHPDTPEVRHDWAQYYDRMTEADAMVGEKLDELKAAGLKDDTIVFFYGDHGSGMPRSKRWPYNSGLQVGLIVYIPEKFKHLAPKDYAAGAASDRLAAFVDLPATLLSLAGIKPPEYMQGHALMGAYEAPPQPYVYGFRGRMDERYDMVRTIRDQRYIYIRNYMPHLIYGQYIDYMFQTPTTQVWKKMYDEGKLNAAQSRFWERKDPEELYDLQSDPDEVVNLAKSADHAEIKKKLRMALRTELLKIRDVGFLSEGEFHRRAELAGTTIYEMGHDTGHYPLDRIMDMANLASMMQHNKIEQLREGLKDSDSGVRYWAAMGILMRGKAATKNTREDLRAALGDESPTVRIIAARALGDYGNEEDLKLALEALRTLVQPDKGSAYDAILAMNALDVLGDKGLPLLDTVRSMKTSDPNAPGRADGYVGRLVDTMKEKYKNV